MARNFIKLGSILSIIIVLLAVIYRKKVDNELDDRVENVLGSLLRAEQKVSGNSGALTRVAVGFGLCTDTFVNGVELFSQLKQGPPEHTRHVDDIHSLQDLAGTFAYFFANGAAAERYMHNRELFKQIVRLSRQRAESWSEMGGNAPVMANRLAREGCEVLLGGRASQETLAKFHQNVKVVGDPVEEEDVHLIMEYKTGAKFGQLTSPRANRFIIHSDQYNPHLHGLEEFQTELLTFDPHVLVLGGLQMMDNFPFGEGEREERLGLLRRLVLDLPQTTPVHLELASFAEEAMMQDLLEYVIPYADSLGMNEQELPNLYSLLHYGNVSLVSDPLPRVATVLDQMRAVYGVLKDLPRGREGQRRTTRIHVHTLAFQAILTREGSSWKNTMSAAAKASLTAHRHVCGSTEVDMNKSRLIMDDSFSVSREYGSRKIPFEANRPVSCWREDDYEICVAPVLVCTDVLRTAGGGDNISSAGLAVQI